MKRHAAVSALAPAIAFVVAIASTGPAARAEEIASDRPAGEVLPPSPPAFGVTVPAAPAGAGGPGARAPDLLGEIGDLEADLESILDRLASLRRVTLGHGHGSFAARRDAVRSRRGTDRASFHARTREPAASALTLDEGKAPLFDDAARKRRASIELAVANAQGDVRRTHALCMRSLSFPGTPSDDVLLLCSVNAVRGTDPAKPRASRLAVAEFKAFALHARVTGGPGGLERAIVNASGYANVGEPVAGLAALREARARALPSEPWAPRALFTEALLRYVTGEADAALDAWRALSGERLAVASSFPFAPEAVDPATRALSLLHAARAYAVRRQWRAAREAYERLIGTPEAFASRALDAAREGDARVLFPPRSLFPRLPDPYEPLERRAVLGELAEVLWKAGDPAAGARAWRASGAPSTPRVLTALAGDPSARDGVTLEAARLLGETRADIAFVRALAAPGSMGAGGAATFDSTKEKATALLALTTLHGDSSEAAAVRATLAKWEPLFASEVAFFAEVARLADAALGPVPFLEHGILERKEWMAYEALLARWKETGRLARRADALGTRSWSESTFASAHRNEIWRRLGAADDAVARLTAALARKGARDNHRENARRVADQDAALDGLEASLASVRFLARAEERRQLEKGTVGVIAFSAWALEGEAVASQLARSRDALAEVSLDARLLTLSDDALFPPDAAFRGRLRTFAASLSELSKLHLASMRPAEEFASGPVRARLAALWARLDEAAGAFAAAEAAILEAATEGRRTLAGEAQAVLMERNAYSAALAGARKASSRAFASDVREAASLLARHLRRLEDEWIGVLASANEARLSEAGATLERVARARREREALLRAFRTSLGSGTAR